MNWLVDTNVILDVLGADPTFGERSKRTLASCAQEGVLVVNPVILAEVSAMLDSLAELNEMLPPVPFRRDPLPFEASFLAGLALYTYKRWGGAKGRMLAGFLIGAHAAASGFGLLTRDAVQARAYLTPRYTWARSAPPLSFRNFSFFHPSASANRVREQTSVRKRAGGRRRCFLASAAVR